MSHYIKLDVGYFTHRKVVKLRRLLGVDAWWVPVRLWCYAVQNEPGGNFSEFSNAELCEAIGYAGDADKLVAALCDCGFMDRDTRTIHNWATRASYHHTYSQRGKSGANARWGKVGSGEERIEKGEEKRRESIASSNASSISTSGEGAELADEAWIDSLKSLPSYHGIDVAREFQKCAEWHRERGREPTRDHVVAWLDRIKPGKGADQKPPTAYTLKEQLAALDERKAAVKRRGNEDAMGYLHLSPKDLAELKEIQAKRDEVVKRLSELT